MAEASEVRELDRLALLRPQPCECRAHPTTAVLDFENDVRPVDRRILPLDRLGDGRGCARR
jgi:hypothetical protein